MLTVEPHHGCIKNLLELIRTWSWNDKILEFIGSKIGWEPLWEHLKYLLRTPAAVAAIVFLGVYVNYVSCNASWLMSPSCSMPNLRSSPILKLRCANSGSKSYKKIVPHSRYCWFEWSHHKVLDLRYAAGQSAHEGLAMFLLIRLLWHSFSDLDSKASIEPGTHFYEPVVEAWLVVLRLLQDEDEEIRMESTRFVSAAAKSHFGADHPIYLTFFSRPPIWLCLEVNSSPRGYFVPPFEVLLI